MTVQICSPRQQIVHMFTSTHTCRHAPYKDLQSMRQFFSHSLVNHPQPEAQVHMQALHTPLVQPLSQGRNGLHWIDYTGEKIIQ